MFKFGSLEKLLRVTCLVRRFVLNLKAKKKGSQGLQGRLSMAEIEKNEVLWLRYEQRIEVQGIPLRKYRLSELVYDEHFLLRSKIRYSEYDKLDTSRKLPLLLRSHLHFINLVIRDAHERVFHNDVNSTLNFLRNKYWLIRGRQSIKPLLRQCVTCKYVNAKTITPPAAPALPKFRIDYSFK